MTTAEVGEQSAGLDVAEPAALLACQTAQGLGNVALPDAHRATEDERLGPPQETQGGQVPDHPLQDRGVKSLLPAMVDLRIGTGGRFRATQSSCFATVSYGSGGMSTVAGSRCKGLPMSTAASPRPPDRRRAPRYLRGRPLAQV